jgi:hypothetical protein
MIACTAFSQHHQTPNAITCALVSFDAGLATTKARSIRAENVMTFNSTRSGTAAIANAAAYDHSIVMTGAMLLAPPHAVLQWMNASTTTNRTAESHSTYQPESRLIV